MMESTRMALREYLEEQDREHWCMRIKHGSCATLRCLREGGYPPGGANQGFVDYDKASCPRWRLQEALDMEP